MQVWPESIGYGEFRCLISDSIVSTWNCKHDGSNQWPRTKQWYDEWPKPETQNNAWYWLRVPSCHLEHHSHSPFSPLHLFLFCCLLHGFSCKKQSRLWREHPHRARNKSNENHLAYLEGFVKHAKLCTKIQCVYLWAVSMLYMLAFLK